MRALVVYDSAFGNTEKVAQAMGEALGSQADVEVLRVTDVRPEQLKGLNVLIVGSPTQAFQPLPAIKGFLRSIPTQGLAGVKVAAFDTRLSMDDIRYVRMDVVQKRIERMAVKVDHANELTRQALAALAAAESGEGA